MIDILAGGTDPKDGSVSGCSAVKKENLCNSLLAEVSGKFFNFRLQ
jgi:hypothetical protein